ncbi:MAG: PolC-type DNA polymerase III [Lachnospiraceae bacterium]|nr:PolC-type DNA polymerase III [Lachnospiraceae bacterium]
METTLHSFYEVFCELKTPEELTGEFSEVLVERLLMKKAINLLEVHILSTKLIHKKSIMLMEKAIKNYMFERAQTKIKIVERYELSELYNPEKLFLLYKDSFLLDFKERSNVEYRLVQASEWFFDNNIITLTLEDTFLAKNKSVSIKKYIEEVYQSKFGMAVQVGFDYTLAQKEQLRQAHKMHKLELEVNSILEEVDSRSKADSVTSSKAKETDGNKKSATVRSSETAKSNGDASKQNGGNRSYFNQENGFRKQRPADDPDVFYGKNCEGDIIEIKDIITEMGEVVIHGELLNLDTREIRSEKTILIFSITDYTDTIVVKIFVPNVLLPDLLGNLKSGKFYKIKGNAILDKYDHEVSISSVVGMKEIPDFRVKRKDLSLEKRVELHLHTVMSESDSVVGIKDVIKLAKSWGHKAMAITDHGVVQAFPVAAHCLDKDDDFKLLYGVEGYFVDDLKTVVVNSKNQSLQDDYVVFDIETTGFSPVKNKIIEIGAVKVRNGVIVDKFSHFVNPKEPIPPNIESLTGISDRMVIEEPTIEVILPEFLKFCEGSVLVAHNADFDVSFIREKSRELNLAFAPTYLDTVLLSRFLITGISKYTLDSVAKYMGVKLTDHHRAVNDAQATAEIFVKFIPMLNSKGIETLDSLNAMSQMSPEAIKAAPSYHGILIAKNELGRVNLYRLISESHLTYFSKRPRMPKSLIEQYREGLIVGSACEAGELYKAILMDKGAAEISRLAQFYDYFEIQPLGNNFFMLESDKYPVSSVEDLKEINRKIVALGEEFKKPVVATCDVHFIEPEDSIYRAIIQASKKYKDADNQPPLYFRTTEEMLEEFEYLGSEKAYEVVIENTNKISDMVERISPVRPDKCPPVIDQSDATLTKICYDKAHEIYGPELPPQVLERLERELNSIISNGFAVMYIIAQKLVWDSNDHGYLVGSRGSVGSSFVATMAGITEVNPLSAHYICKNCHYVDFDSDEVKAFAGRSGCDMPDKNCPNCGEPLMKEGHDIPFETFLGFKGDKEPDIDLNFSGEYQACAHAYTEELFGKGKAFRAGTIGSVADKTAYSYVYKYFEERQQNKRRAEMERLSLGCTGVKRTTGQHPGGMIVLPRNEEIYSFTPIQHPANDVNSPIITTHFEYHSIDHNLLKLDILGHDDPSMIRMMEDLTGIDAKTIKLDDKKVMSLFHNTEALGITPEDIGGTKLGSLGIPEFGTDFVIQMLIDTNPQSFSDLVRISGLSHGTDVWLGNAQTLIQEGKALISTAICTRDDIMIYLINMGMDKGLSFTIMESVRKGKGLKPEWEEEMLAHNVPDWYIWSCKKIKYMFPKAHAAAYVMMAWRIAYFKVYYPLAYYATFFSIRAKAFSYEKMCQGRERLEMSIKEITSKPKEEQTAVEQDSLRDMKLVQEMYARGFEFLPLDIFVADDVKFQIMDGKIMPSLVTIDGLGDKAATALKEAAKNGPFLSKDDLKERAKISATVTDKMQELGLLGDIPESNQLSFVFDF